jgi:hypothetical protein
MPGKYKSRPLGRLFLDSDARYREAGWPKGVGPVKIATYNVNGVNGRLPVLLAWLGEASPDVVCLQELKSPDAKFLAAAIRAAGYGAIWHGR